MKQFTITWVTQAMFDEQGFVKHWEKVQGAVNTYWVVKSIRNGLIRPVMIWVTCE